MDRLTERESLLSALAAPTILLGVSKPSKSLTQIGANGLSANAIDVLIGIKARCKLRSRIRDRRTVYGDSHISVKKCKCPV